jgi:hypothetical protein
VQKCSVLNQVAFKSSRPLDLRLSADMIILSLSVAVDEEHFLIG